MHKNIGVLVLSSMMVGVNRIHGMAAMASTRLNNSNHTSDRTKGEAASVEKDDVTRSRVQNLDGSFNRHGRIVASRIADSTDIDSNGDTVFTVTGMKSEPKPSTNSVTGELMLIPQNQNSYRISLKELPIVIKKLDLFRPKENKQSMEGEAKLANATLTPEEEAVYQAYLAKRGVIYDERQYNHKLCLLYIDWQLQNVIAFTELEPYEQEYYIKCRMHEVRAAFKQGYQSALVELDEYNKLVHSKNLSTIQLRELEHRIIDDFFQLPSGWEYDKQVYNSYNLPKLVTDIVNGQTLSPKDQKIYDGSVLKQIKDSYSDEISIFIKKELENRTPKSQRYYIWCRMRGIAQKLKNNTALTDEDNKFYGAFIKWAETEYRQVPEYPAFVRKYRDLYYKSNRDKSSIIGNLYRSAVAAYFDEKVDEDGISICV